MIEVEGVLVSGCHGEKNLGDDLMLEVAVQELLKLFSPSEIYVRGDAKDSILKQFCLTNQLGLIDRNLKVKADLQVIAGGSIFEFSEDRFQAVGKTFSFLPKSLQRVLARNFFKFKYPLKPETFHMVPANYTIGLGVGLEHIPKSHSSRILILGQVTSINRIYARDITSKFNFLDLTSGTIDVQKGTDLVFNERNFQHALDKKTQIAVVLRKPKYKKDEVFHASLLKKLLAKYSKSDLHLYFFSGYEREIAHEYRINGYEVSVYDGSNASDLITNLQSSKIVFTERLHGILLSIKNPEHVIIISSKNKLKEFFVGQSTGLPKLPVVDGANVSNLELEDLIQEKFLVRNIIDFDALIVKSFEMRADFHNELKKVKGRC